MPLPWLGRPQKVTTWNTENPIEEIWHQLAVLKYEKFIRRETAHFDQSKIDFITGSFTQAHEYRIAARNSSDHTRPLLLYYCFMNLTKAVLAALEHEVNPYHGLKRPSVEGSDLLKSTILVDEGVFMSLAKYLNTDISRDFVITVDRVLKRIVEMKTSYEYSYRKKSEVIVPAVKVLNNGQFTINITKEQLEEPDHFQDSWKTIFPQLEEMFDYTDADSGKFTLTMKEAFIPSKENRDEFIKCTGSKLFDHNVSIGRFVPALLAHSDDYNLPKICLYYAMLYFLSMLVRYEPDTWYQSVVDNKVGEMWVMSKFCTLAERVFPNLIYNMLFDSNTVFSSGSSL